MSRLLRVLGVLIALLVLGAGFVWLELRPPAPLAVPERGAVIPAVTVVEPGLGRFPGRTIVVEGDRITDVREATRAEMASSGAERFALPGLVDMHVHFPPIAGLGQTELFSLLFLLHGVTTVRDAGDVQGTATAPARDGVASGRFPGPRVFACGPFLDGPGARWANSEIVETAQEAGAAVERIAAAGFDCVKVYDDLSREALEGAREAGARLGIPLIGHVPTRLRFEEALLDDVQHSTGIAWAEGVGFPERMGLWADLDQARMDSVLTAAVEHDIAMTPTWVTRDRLSHMDQPDVLSWAPEAALLPRLYRDVVWRVPSWPSKAFRDFARSLAIEAPLLRRMHAAGVRIHLGTDALAVAVVPGAGLHREMRLFEAAGFTPDEIWQMGARVPAQALGVPDLGRLATGAPADVLVYRSDPTQTLDALDTLELVVADGRAYAVADLRAQLERYRQQFEGAVFDWLTVQLARRAAAAAVRNPPAPEPQDASASGTENVPARD